MRRLSLLSYTKSIDVHCYSPISNLLSWSQKLQFSVGGNVESFSSCPLQDPTMVRSLHEAKSLHALAITMGPLTPQEPVFLFNNVMSKYASFGEIHVARDVFDEMPKRNAVSYNTMISACCRDGFLQEALRLFSDMRTCGLEPTQFTYGSLFSSHGLNIFEGVQLHALIEKNGFLHGNSFGGTALLGMYGNHGFQEEAYTVFEFMPEKNVVTWNSMISVFARIGWIKVCVLMLSEMMMMSHVGVSEYTFVSIISSLEEGDHLPLGEQIHGLVFKFGFNNIPLISNCLINMYAKLESSFSAEKLLKNASDKDTVSWNTVIKALVDSNKPIKAIDYLSKMMKAGLSPNEATLSNILASCSCQHLSSLGHCIHGLIVRKGLESDVHAGSSLVNFYAKNDEPHKAQICFDGITHKNTVSWNSLLLAWSKCDSNLCTELLKRMIFSGFALNEVSLSVVIKSSAAAPRELRQLHAVAVKEGHHENPHVSSSLMSSYAKNGLIHDALVFAASSSYTVVSANIVAWIYNRSKQYEKTQELYASMENPDAISWNILIAACSRNGDYKETFELFDSMRTSPQISPDRYTYVSLFSVCTRLSNLALGSSLHGLIIKTEFKACDTFLLNTMVDMYGKCGSLQSSVKVFDEITEKNIISWTCYISVLGLHGYADEALEGFTEMEGAGFLPDGVCFAAVLSACRHAGLVREGLEVFNAMRSKYGVEPGLDHYYLVVNLLSRYGDLMEAERFIVSMPMAPNALVWRAFLQGCKEQRNRGVITADA